MVCSETRGEGRRDAAAHSKEFFRLRLEHTVTAAQTDSEKDTTAAKDLPLLSWLTAGVLGWGLFDLIASLLSWQFAIECVGPTNLTDATMAPCRSQQAALWASLALAALGSILGVVAFAHRKRFMKVIRIALVGGAVGCLLLMGALLEGGHLLAATINAALAVMALAAHFGLKRTNFAIPKDLSILAVLLGSVLFFGLSILIRMP